MTELRGADYWRRVNEGKRLLRGEDTFSSFPSMNPLQRDLALTNGTFITENRYIMLLTLEEAQQVTEELLGEVDEFFPIILPLVTSKIFLKVAAISAS